MPTLATTKKNLRSIDENSYAVPRNVFEVYNAEYPIRKTHKQSAKIVNIAQTIIRFLSIHTSVSW